VKTDGNTFANFIAKKFPSRFQFAEERKSDKSWRREKYQFTFNGTSFFGKKQHFSEADGEILLVFICSRSRNWRKSEQRETRESINAKQIFGISSSSPRQFCTDVDTRCSKEAEQKIRPHLFRVIFILFFHQYRSEAHERKIIFINFPFYCCLLNTQVHDKGSRSLEMVLHGGDDKHKITNASEREITFE
jgi:hypothetical protein